MVELIMNQKSEFLRYFNDYLVWNENVEGKHNLQEHREHQKYFQERMSKKSLESMDLSQFKELYKKLWASNYFSNEVVKPNPKRFPERRMKWR